MSEPDPMEVVNSTAGEEAVYRADGVRLYGMDAEIEKKVCVCVCVCVCECVRWKKKDTIWEE